MQTEPKEVKRWVPHGIHLGFDQRQVRSASPLYLRTWTSARIRQVISEGCIISPERTSVKRPRFLPFTGSDAGRLRITSRIYNLLLREYHGSTQSAKVDEKGEVP